MQITKLVKGQIRIDDKGLNNKSIILSDEEQKDILRFFKAEKSVMWMDVIAEE